MTSLLIVGAGSIGSRHARNARALGVADIAVVDPVASRADALAAELGGAAHATLDAALQRRYDAAIICTPPALHAAAVTACAGAGCRLLIEKPLAATVEDADAMTAAVERAGVQAVVAYQLRFHPAVARLRALAAGGGLGRLLSMRAEYGNYLPAWRPGRDYRDTYTAQARLGGGILLDASHEIDYVRWIMGEVRGVYCAAGTLSDLEMDVEDTAALVLRFDRAIGEVHLDCVQRGYARGCTIVGGSATARWHAATGLRITAADGSTHDEPIVPEGNAAYVAELRSFLDGGDDRAWASLADARQVVRIVAAARESSAARREVSV